MGTPANASAIWRFGVFEIDARTGELRRNGQSIKLREQPARILLILLEHAGELVTREQLRQRLWPSDTFVDFDHSLNSAVMKLREALGDSTDRPLYIETIPKKGYRFLAPISQSGEAQPGEAQPGDARNAVPSSGLLTVPPPSTPAEMEASSGAVGPIDSPVSAPEKKAIRWPRRRLLQALAVLLSLSAASIAGWMQWRPRAAPVPSASNVVSANLRITPITAVTGLLFGPAFSPDGRQIAFTWDGPEHRRPDVYVQLVSGGTPLRLTFSKTGYVSNPAWSPDGREIAFSRCDGKTDGIYTVPALGGPERKLTSSTCLFWDGGSPIWTPDGRSVLLADECRPGGPRGIVLLSLATGVKRCLTEPPSTNADDSLFALSPDGRTLAFLGSTSADTAEIYTVPLAGGTPRRLTDEHQDIYALMWTPDGRYITFVSTRATEARAWRVPAAGGAVEPELVYPGVGSLSKDGQRFAYVQFQGGEPPAIWQADLSAPGGRALKNRKLISSQIFISSAQLSPDGARMVFQSGRTGRCEIWLSGASGEGPLQLTSFGRLSGSPHWSPDSRWIAFDTRPHEYGQIFVIDAEGRNLHAITSGDYENIVPSWSHDGKAIYFVSKRTGSYQIWKHVLANGAEMQLTRGGGFSPLESYDGTRVYYTKFQQGGIWSIPANGGEESLVVPDMPQVGYWGYWTVTEGGLYLLDADAEPRPTIKFYSFATHRLSPVLSLEQSPRPWGANLSASPDGRRLFYAEGSGMSVIELAENFR